MIAEMCNGDENLLLSLVDFKKILVKNLKITVLHKSRPGDPKVPTAKKDLIITWNSNKLRPNTALEEYLTLCGNIDNIMDIDEDNDANLGVNVNSTCNSMIDNSAEMNCEAISNMADV